MKLENEFIVMTEKEYDSFMETYKLIVENPETSDELLKELNEMVERIAFE